MKNTFTISIPNIPENRKRIDDILAWSDSIPTVYFLDICSISRIKTILKINGDISPSSQRDFSLKKIDMDQNAISYMPALMEKASDQRCKWSVNELIEEATRDLEAIGSFFERARMLEPIRRQLSWPVRVNYLGRLLVVITINSFPFRSFL